MIKTNRDAEIRLSQFPSKSSDQHRLPPFCPTPHLRLKGKIILKLDLNGLLCVFGEKMKKRKNDVKDIRLDS